MLLHHAQLGILAPVARQTRFSVWELDDVHLHSAVTPLAQ